MANATQHLMVRVGERPPMRLCETATPDELAERLVAGGFAFTAEQSQSIEFGEFCDDCSVLILTAEVPGMTPEPKDRQWVNAERTVLVSQWTDGTMTVALRDESWESWGPPITVEEEK